MHKKKSDLQIGKNGVFSNSDIDPAVFLPSFRQKHVQFQIPQRLTSRKPNSVSPAHLKIKIPASSSSRNPTSASFAPILQNSCWVEPRINNPSTSVTLLSNLLKRLILMPQIISSSLLERRHRLKASQTTLLCCSSSEAIFITKEMAIKLFRHSHMLKNCWIKTPFRVFFLVLFFPSVYFFSLNHHRSLFLYLLSLIAFSSLLYVSLNHPTIPRLPSILARTFPIKLSSSKISSDLPQPVVWSIGSKTKLEEGADSGCCVKVYSNGDVYEGEFYKGKCSGSGVYYYSLNGKYEGEWINQKYDGYGVETWAKGSRYRGQYRQGLRHGLGTYRFYTGDVYSGEWSKGQCHGCGILTCEDGSKYAGEFKGGIKHGLGHYHFRNGDAYVGEYFADKIHGFGVYRFANGHRYEGGWHEGRRQGFGLYSFSKGQSQSGHWENGVLSVSTSQGDGLLHGYPSSVAHAKVLHAVEEARRAAEGAMAVVGDVEEKVNKTVASANRAANAARVAAVKAVQNRVHPNDLPLPFV